MSKDTKYEEQIQDKGLTAPRVTPDDLEANIASIHFFTAAHGVAGALNSGQLWQTTRDTDTLNGQQFVPGNPLTLLTFCVLVLRNGFTVTGESACVSPENFDAEIGRNVAFDNAKAKIWPLMGYALRDKLSAN